MRKFGLITNAYKDKDLHLTHQIADYIHKNGGEAICISERNGVILDYEQMDYSNIPEGLDCLMVLGGDGTLIRAATGTRKFHIPLIGVNLGTLGYLCELEEDTVFPAIERLMNEEYKIDERMMLQGRRPGAEHGKSALNDIVIHRTGDLSLLSLQVYVNGEFLTTYDADGVILSTPTGSTGYNMSAGGPIVDPKARMILLTPINAHNLNSRSIVLSADDVIEIEMGSRRYQKDEVACVSCDGDKIDLIKVGDRFVISRSKHIIQICKLNKRSFLEILSKKMGSYT